MKENRVKSAVILKETVDDSHKFKPLPAPTGSYPYRLRLEDVLEDAADAFQDKISFHMLGDTGSPRYSAFQAVVAHVLNGQSNRELHAEDTPAFLYHLGDIVYNHGEASAYPAQFLKPYERYEAPIFAIAGNHDGDINPESKVPYESLDAFMHVFCDTERRPIAFADDSTRKSMIQPHVYWTLETPTARFIGLYPNTPKHGEIDAEQRDWFINELRHADGRRHEQAIIVCIHHAPFSADTNHGSSEKMINFLEDAFQVANTRPDIVFSGHVHNYQRFSRSYTDGQTIPFIVAGAGGYVDLHRVARTDDDFVEEIPIREGMVCLESFCEERYGFLKISVERAPDGLLLHGGYYILPETAEDVQRVEPALFDHFSLVMNRDTRTSYVASEYTPSPK